MPNDDGKGNGSLGGTSVGAGAFSLKLPCSTAIFPAPDNLLAISIGCDAFGNGHSVAAMTMVPTIAMPKTANPVKRFTARTWRRNSSGHRAFWKLSVHRIGSSA